MSDKTLSILIGGLAFGLVAVLLALPQVQILGCLICLTYAGAGMLAVWHYTNTQALTITGGEGAGMGALSGLVAGAVASLLGWILRAIGVMPSTDDIIRQMEDSGQFDQLDADTVDMIYGWIEFSTGIGGVLIALIIALILGVIGGAIGAAVFKKGSQAPGAASDVV